MWVPIVRGLASWASRPSASIAAIASPYVEVTDVTEPFRIKPSQEDTFTIRNVNDDGGVLASGLFHRAPTPARRCSE